MIFIYQLPTLCISMYKLLFLGRLRHSSSNSGIAKPCFRVGPGAWNLAVDKLHNDKSILLGKGGMARKTLREVTWVQQFAVKYHLTAACRIRLKFLNCSLQLQRYCISAGTVHVFDYGNISDSILGLVQSGASCGWNYLSSLRTIPCTDSQKDVNNTSLLLAVAEQWWHSTKTVSPNVP